MKREVISDGLELTAQQGVLFAFMLVVISVLCLSVFFLFKKYSEVQQERKEEIKNNTEVINNLIRVFAEVKQILINRNGSSDI